MVQWTDDFTTDAFGEMLSVIYKHRSSKNKTMAISNKK